MAIGTTMAIGLGLAAAGGGVAYASHQQSKAEEKALSAAQEQEQRAIEEARRTEERIEAATKLTPVEMEREQRLLGLAPGEERVQLAETGLEQQRQAELERRAGLSGEDLLKEVGPETRRLLELVAKEQGMTGEQLFMQDSEVARALREQVLSGAQQPGGAFEDALNAQLQRSFEQTAAELNRRGVLRAATPTGIGPEAFGRAAVDVAINSAAQREQARQQDLANASALVTQFLNLREAALGRGAEVATAGLGEQERARAEMADFLVNLQNLRETARGRQATGVVQGQQIATPMTSAGMERRSSIEQEVFGGQAQSAAETKRAALEFGGQLIGGGIQSSVSNWEADQASKRRQAEWESLLAEDPLDRIGGRVGAGIG